MFLPFVRGSLEIFPVLQRDVELPCKLAPGVVRVMVICRGNGCMIISIDGCLRVMLHIGSSASTARLFGHAGETQHLP